jgi:hypothetical protein
MARVSALARSVFAGLLVIEVAEASARAAEPMDLRDPRPRWISVRFENSPLDQPGQLATQYTAELPAWFEPDRVGNRVRVTIAGSAVESGRFEQQRLRAGSFSDFVWLFDASSGEVLSARVRGTLIRRLDFGVFGSDVDLPFEAEMTTRSAVGFEAVRHTLGQLVFPFCERAERGCTLVAPVRYDSRTGYVNAVGSIVARAIGAAARTFSPLGEAIFSERDGADRDRGDFAVAR